MGANFLIDGGFAFLRAGELTEAWSDEQVQKFLEFKNPNYVCATITSGWLMGMISTICHLLSATEYKAEQFCIAEMEAKRIGLSYRATYNGVTSPPNFVTQFVSRKRLRLLESVQRMPCSVKQFNNNTPLRRGPCVNH